GESDVDGESDGHWIDTDISKDELKELLEDQ
nr:hypothetical protein [Tanacetum cinerariifolium]